MLNYNSIDIWYDKISFRYLKRNKLVGNQETVNNNANTTTSNDSSTKDNGKNGTTGEENNEQNNSTDESNTGTILKLQDNTGILPANIRFKRAIPYII